MAFEATFRHGSPLTVDHTPSGAAVAAGQVVLIGDLTTICHTPIADGVLGAVAAGGGVYEVTADAAIAIGKKVYWDNTNNKVTETATGNKVFGVTLEAAAGDGSLIDVLHNPGF